jgi:Lysyl oxidase
MKRTVIKWGVLLAAIGTSGITACAAKNDPAEQQEPAKDLGKIEFKLTATTPQGVTYRLRDAIIMIQGPEDTLFFDTEENVDRDVWRANVPPGDYTYFIQEGWRMERLGEHAEPNVGAELTSPNPGEFHVESQTTVSVPLRFRVGEHVMSDGAFEVSIEVTEEGEPHENTFCTSDEQCGAGETCCSGGFLGTCMQVGDSGSCPLPDLIVMADTAAQSIYISRETFGVDSCALAEECVNGPGERRLLKFATETANVGPMDVILGNPSEDMGFEFSECHSHFHFEGYAAYELKNEAGDVVATGHKQAFCLLDSNQVEGSRPGQFHCGFQGITAVGATFTARASIASGWTSPMYRTATMCSPSASIPNTPSPRATTTTTS